MFNLLSRFKKEIKINDCKNRKKKFCKTIAMSICEFTNCLVLILGVVYWGWGGRGGGEISFSKRSRRAVTCRFMDTYERKEEKSLRSAPEQGSPRKLRTPYHIKIQTTISNKTDGGALSRRGLQ